MIRSLVCSVLVLVFTTLTFAQAPIPTPPNPILGVWKQNMEKSTYSPGPPPPTYSVRQYAAGIDGSIVAITMNVNLQGIPSLGAISAANYDGKEYVQHTVATLATSLSSHIEPRVERTISYKSVNLYTVEITQKEEGKIVSRSTRTVSRDGKTMTEHVDFSNAPGQRVNNVLVFEKQ